jgi:hypothetical protein
MVKLNSSVEHSTSAVAELRWLATMYNVLQLLWSLKKKPEIHQSSKQQHSTAVPKQITRLHAQLRIITQHLKTCSAKTYSITSATRNYHATLKKKQRSVKKKSKNTCA